MRLTRADHAWIRIRWYSMDVLHTQESKELEWAFVDFLKALNRPGLKANGMGFDLFPQATTASHAFTLHRPAAEAAAIFVRKWVDLQTAFRKEQRELPEKIKEQIASERNIIFNKGLETGRKLLLQLNQGTITMSEFEKTINKY